MLIIKDEGKKELNIIEYPTVCWDLYIFISLNSQQPTSTS